jgi:hypothetical protein
MSEELLCARCGASLSGRLRRGRGHPGVTVTPTDDGGAALESVRVIVCPRCRLGTEVPLRSGEGSDEL